MLTRRPSSCSIVLLTQCILKCRMCEMWKSPAQASSITTEDWKSFIDSLEGVLDGSKEIVFSGGEPLLKKDILELVRFGTDKGFKTLMPSNGYLIDEEMAKRIADSGLKEMFISLDSINPDTHDFLRGTKGSYDRVMKAFDNLQRFCPDLRVGIITVISGVNYKEIGELSVWIKNNSFLSGVYFQAIAKPFFSQAGDDWYLNPAYQLLWPEKIQEVHSALDALIRLRNQGYPIHNFPLQLEIFKTYFNDPSKRARKAPCYAGDYVINVNPQGDISLCCFMKPIGNIKNDNIKELWNSAAARESRDAMHCCQLNCNNMVNCFFKEEEEK
ncbi:MAG: radical SAM protein [Candidatus Omnitrophica bacterium]|nr:radical SAM protein [Candidatus Omnitrophota bacterium]